MGCCRGVIFLYKKTALFLIIYFLIISTVIAGILLNCFNDWPTDEERLRNSISNSISVKFMKNGETIKCYYPNGSPELNDYFVWIYDDLIPVQYNFGESEWSYRITFNYTHSEPIGFTFLEEGILMNEKMYLLENMDYSAVLERLSSLFNYYSSYYPVETLWEIPNS